LFFANIKRKRREAKYNQHLILMNTIPEEEEEEEK
jgi:hypothetical protein